MGLFSLLIEFHSLTSEFVLVYISPKYLFQVVAGWNYVIKYEIKETNCSKAQFQELTTECKTISQGVSNLQNLIITKISS